MRIGLDDLLERDENSGIEIVGTGHHGGPIVPIYLVIHYTAGSSGESSVSHFMQPDAKASAHVVIDRSGKIWQLVPFRISAWHAGISAWAGRQSLNGFSIGIELDNAGRLTRFGSSYQAWFGRTYPESQVVHARHKNEAVDAYWHAYTEAQLLRLLELSRLLVSTYRLIDVVGHDDIAPGRKSDPGPAFAIGSFRAALFGRGDSTGAEYLVAAPALNLRGAPSTDAPVLTTLAAQTRLCLLEMRSLWARVLLLEGAQTEGWVRNSFIIPASN